MSKSVSIFLPVRKGSKRVKNKNTKQFAGFKGGLLELKLNQIIKVKNADEIIVSSNDKLSINIAQSFRNSCSKVKIFERPDYLARDDTDLTDLIKHAETLAKSEHILWTHVTSPFVNELSYDKMINLYFKELLNGYDSLMSVTAIQNFLWDKDKNDIINRRGKLRWPRTQDLKTLYEINSAVFLSSKKNYRVKSDRIGINPLLFELETFESIDIDWEEDFKLAEILYQSILR